MDDQNNKFHFYIKIFIVLQTNERIVRYGFKIMLSSFFTGKHQQQKIANSKIKCNLIKCCLLTVRITMSKTLNLPYMSLKIHKLVNSFFPKSKSLNQIFFSIYLKSYIKFYNNFVRKLIYKFQPTLESWLVSANLAKLSKQQFVTCDFIFYLFSEMMIAFSII